MDYNGMKLVRENARPISADTGLKDIQELAAPLPALTTSLSGLIFCGSIYVNK
jgi:phosphomannomutase